MKDHKKNKLHDSITVICEKIVVAPWNVVSSLLFFLEETYSNTREEHAYFTLSAA